jgi:hypothetical protein
VKTNVTLSGFDSVFSAMRTSGFADPNAWENGLLKGGLLLQRESQAIVPVQFGPLRASAFTRNVGRSGFDADVIVGYTAAYAVFVHENLEAAHGADFNVKHANKIAGMSDLRKSQHRKVRVKDIWFLRGENQQAKFLEQPARQYRMAILQVIGKTIVNEVLRKKK